MRHTWCQCHLSVRLCVFACLWGTHLCNLCVDTRWLAHVLRDRPDDSYGEGGLLQVRGPVADALWFQR